MSSVMKNLIVTILLCFSYFLSIGQSKPADQAIITPEQEAASQKWLANLYEMGVEIRNDSMILNEEAKRVLTDTTYYNFIYPKVYDWRIVQVLMKRMALKQAFWYMINLYHSNPKNKELVLQTIVPYDRIMEMDKIMISTLYSYISFDPEVSILEIGKAPVVKRPDIAEQKMLATKEIVSYILSYREQQNNTNN